MQPAFKHFPEALRAVGAVAILLFGAAACASAQTASTSPAFEVATIKPAAPFDPIKFGPRVNLSRASFTYMSVHDLVWSAYQIMSSQVSGPSSIDSEHYDIQATIPEGASRQDVPLMLQDLLKNRFKLQLHIEKKEAQAYALVVGKQGSKLKPSPSDSPKPDTDAPLKPGESYVGDGEHKFKQVKNQNGSTTTDLGKNGSMTTGFDRERGTIHWGQSKITMEELAKMLPHWLGADGGRYVVVDETGIKGNYQIDVDYPIPGFRRPNIPMAGGNGSEMIPSDPENGDALTRSLDAMGLKLEKRKAQIDVYVIDHVEKPSEN